jgi:hypothetical protein
MKTCVWGEGTDEGCWQGRHENMRMYSFEDEKWK